MEEAVAPGRRLAGRYVLEELIASGGMAAVWRARDEVLARNVAVKILRQDLSDDPGFAERFHREAVSAASLTHPNIVSVFDAGLEDGVRYIVMEHFDGPTLQDIMVDEGPMDPRRAVEMMMPVLSALGVAHDAGVVHRDIKPANVLVGNGQVKVTDFGIARAAFATRDLTATGALIGTARYLSPEQVHGGEIDGRSDLYSAGVVLYEMLTGRPPFDAPTDLATAMMRLTTTPPEPRALRPGIPADLERAVLRSMARDPEQRFPSAHAMRAAMERHSSGSGSATTILTRSPGRSRPSSREPVFRSWMLVPLILLLLAAVAVVAGLALGRLEVGGPLLVRPAPEESGAVPSALQEVAILGAQDFDPQGDGAEHAEEVSLAADGATATAWGTDHYNSEAFGGLKQGLGLWVDLRGSPEVRRITVVSPIDGWTFQVQAGTLPNDLSAPLASTSGGSTFEVRSGKAVIDVEPVKAPGLLIWITALGPDEGRWAAAVSEVRVMGGSS